MDRLSNINKIPSIETLERVQGLRDRGQNQDKSPSHESPQRGDEEAASGGIEDEEREKEMSPEEETGVEDQESKIEGETSCQDGGTVKGRVIDIKA
ncbi:MAG: hypothetical protein KJ970_14675 [Candidatus Eisenbacteria bacterium]|uniref:Uncharacterized protein n=1 Tax=Eiseniibacteriota bacterium TaxID=2212470 RepID=A0A948RW82_UNCEI|nr:hypothetical protein [Candidatus Eisenbacteria bacterium]MBU1950964.1 hypothetical protein [Candidatus Eisenbacteria bacterium]MBU2692163.1 hypothetical protein [Candidatus Eisenbacteria bacterium]